MTIILAIIASFGGAPLFTYLAERVKGSAAIKKSERSAFEKERAEFRKERDRWLEEQRRDAQNQRLENKTMRDAMNDLISRNGWLEGQLKSERERVDELEEEIRQLRGRQGMGP